MRPQFKPVLWSLLGLSLVVLLVVWFIGRYQYVEKEIEAGYRGHAAENPFYAMQLLLEKMGLDVHSIHDVHELDKLPPVDVTLFIPVHRITLGLRKTEQLLQWVRSGGHLVVAAQPKRRKGAEGLPDKLLSPLGVKVQQIAEEEPGNPFSADQRDDAADCESEQETQTGQPDVDSGDQPLWCDPESVSDEPDGGTAHIQKPSADGPQAQENTFASDSPQAVKPDTADSGNTETQSCEEKRNPWVRIELEGRKLPLEIAIKSEIEDAEGKASWVVPGKHASAVLQYTLGTGFVTVLGAVFFMRNKEIGKLDHAEFAWRLATWAGREGGAWVVYGEKRPSILKLLLKNAWPVLLSSILLLVLWLYGKMLRFGPVVPLPDRPRRSIMEHIDASGRFLWSRGKGGVLLASIQWAILRKAEMRITNWKQMSNATRYQRLAELSDLTPAQVESALAHFYSDIRSDLVETMRILETLRKAI